MGKIKTRTLTGSGSGTTNSTPLRTDWRSPRIGLSLNTDGSTTGFTAQFTLDDPTQYADATAWAAGATWHNVTDIAAVTADTEALIVGPTQGVRLQANASGTDTGILTIIVDDTYGY